MTNLNQLILAQQFAMKTKEDSELKIMLHSCEHFETLKTTTDISQLNNDNRNSNSTATTQHGIALPAACWVKKRRTNVLLL